MKNPGERKPGTPGEVPRKRRRLPKSFSPDELLKVWRDSRDSGNNAGAPGIDKVRATAFNLNINANLDRVRRELQYGDYRFRKLRIAPILKPSGKYRIVAVPIVQDRLIQRAVLRHLREHERNFSAESEVSFGFVREKTLTDAQRRARDYRVDSDYVFQTDIEKFFDSIPRAVVKEKVRKSVRTKCIRELLLQIVDLELDYRDPELIEIAGGSGIKPGRGLRQGMPVSPLLSNLLLKDFDAALIKARLRAVRYADDITIFCDTRNSCRDAHRLVASELSKFGLKIPDIEVGSKTGIFGPTEDVEFLGVVLRKTEGGCRILAPNKKIAAIEEKLFKIGTKEECWEKRMTLQRAARLMESITMGYEHALAIAENRPEFTARLAAARTKAFNNLLVSVLGKRVVDELGDVGRAILGLQEFPSSRRSARIPA